MAGDEITEPFPISVVTEKYLLFDINVIAHIRRNYNICGILVGSLPQVPQQNVFLGLPVQLMPEEARVLVEQGHAYLVDDAKAHAAAFLQGGLSDEERNAFRRVVGAQGREASLAVRRQAEERRDKALRKVAAKQGRQRQRQSSEATTDSSSTLGSEASGASLFSVETDDTASTASTISPSLQMTPFALTPTTSAPPLQSPRDQFTAPLPTVSASYPLFARLHSLGYFMMPGLRFGCQYNVYPGDPLRFHSHFLAVGRKWDEEFRMMEVVGGGRLGTGVKKGFMIGGEVEDEDGVGEGQVRAFCFEWAGM